MKSRLLVSGHRGARAVLPENTIPGFIHAIEAGADAIELDVVATADDVLAVCHDLVLRRSRCLGPPGRRTVRRLQWSELARFDCGSLVNPRFPRQKPVPGAGIPSLDDVLRLAGLGDFLFQIEVKTIPRMPGSGPPPDRFAELLLERIRAHGLEARVIVQSFDFRVLRALRRLAPGIALAALDQFGLRSFRMIARRSGAGIVAPFRRLATRRKVRLAQAAGIQVIPWTSNTPRDWNRLIRAGVDGIITDDPGGLIAHLRATGLR